MDRVLKKLGYEVCDKCNIANRKLNCVDYILNSVYMIISLFNAIIGMGVLGLAEMGANGEVVVSSNFFRTLLLIIINAIVLVRMNIKLYIESKDREKDAEKKMDENQKQFVSIRIKVKALDNHIKALQLCYILDAVILVINMLFLKNDIGVSLSFMIIVPILLTFTNNLIDIAKNKYCAEAKIAYEFSTLEGVIINGK